MSPSMHRNRLAVLIDGGFFLRRLKPQFPGIDHTNPKVVARLIHAHAIRHRYQKTGRDESGRHIFESFELYRIFYYDCPPFSKKMHYPVTKKAIDFAKSEQAVFRNTLHDELRKKRKVALRMGHLLDTSSWRLKASTLAAVLKDENTELGDEDFELDTIQKGVDMRLGLDVAALSYKRLVDQIVLVVGDSDFVPAAKLARREGIDIILDPLGQAVHAHLHEHTDGVRTPPMPVTPPAKNGAPGATQSKKSKKVPTSVEAVEHAEETWSLPEDEDEDGL
ncbi:MULTISPECIES: NYN domain-containing protein [unclassified Mesorhizobium]|uniref:NYN domain-containing protein n=1 Tax=unclassified Mesorhizobium TaxID=325217 RepID=UPI001AEE915A|nr:MULTISPECIES: NYN domain-containing protein [unclassified Mesorhizobium]